MDVEEWFLGGQEVKHNYVQCKENNAYFCRRSSITMSSVRRTTHTFAIELRMSREKLDTGYFLKSQW